MDIDAISWPRVFAETGVILVLILLFQQYQRGEITVSVALLATAGAFCVIVLRELYTSRST
ncbi:hypothetical protein OB955_06650 [Halobacteria archaeon AArc-m2/3/4]|uniref:Uncharacterized protein n=1 Tax=Natronoglomus mannanivorans TaxID=2979990 RepID=A0ABT2QBV7_9EURY|nr:hypothetical protein [Halobacteria archaeon AArc-m2/3/4]